jgi:hypothetical protein
MDRQELLAAIAAARPGQADIVYVERRGEDYHCRVSDPGEDLLIGGLGDGSRRLAPLVGRLAGRRTLAPRPLARSGPPESHPYTFG